MHIFTQTSIRDWNPVRNKVIVSLELIIECCGHIHVVGVVDGCAAGQPRRPPPERANSEHCVITQTQYSQVNAVPSCEGERHVFLPTKSLIAPLHRVATHYKMDIVVLLSEIIHSFSQVSLAGYAVPFPEVTYCHSIAATHVNADERLRTTVATGAVIDARQKLRGRC